MALQKAQSENWAEDPHWLNLVQYHKNIFGRWRSRADSDKFFLAPEGRSHPELELQATLKALAENQRLIRSQDGKYNESVACVFPARKLWLEHQLKEALPSPSCERYQRFLEILQPQSLTYVFSSYYLNNPASAFGHTFLRVNKAPSSRDGERYELADYGIGYAALQVSQNPLVYSFLGVSGLMPGAFDVHPYYFKVREYNDFESRDLWEYDLNFTPEEVQMMIAYIWELSDVTFNYHYFTENCSYRILSIFEAAKPELHLIDRLKWQVLPADTVQLVYETPGLVKSVHYRPSVRAVFLNHYEQMDSVLKPRIEEFAKKESLTDLTQSLNESQKRDVLDAVIDYLDYKYPQQILKHEGKYAFKKEILGERAELGGISPPVTIQTPSEEAPEKAAGSRRLGLGHHAWNQERDLIFSAKLALHDLLDPLPGFPPTAEITMGDFVFSSNEANHQVTLDHATLFEVVSLAPHTDFSNSLSWRLKVANERGMENNCIGLCRWSELSGGVGWAKDFGNSFEASLWWRLTGQSSPDFQGASWRAGLGPAALIRWHYGSWNVLAESYKRYDDQGSSKSLWLNSLGAQWNFQDHEAFRLEGESKDSQQDWQISYYYYY